MVCTTTRDGLQEEGSGASWERSGEGRFENFVWSFLFPDSVPLLPSAARCRDSQVRNAETETVPRRLLAPRRQTSSRTASSCRADKMAPPSGGAENVQVREMNVGGQYIHSALRIYMMMMGRASCNASTPRWPKGAPHTSGYPGLTRGLISSDEQRTAIGGRNVQQRSRRSPTTGLVVFFPIRFSRN